MTRRPTSAFLMATLALIGANTPAPLLEREPEPEPPEPEPPLPGPPQFPNLHSSQGVAERIGARSDPAAAFRALHEALDGTPNVVFLSPQEIREVELNDILRESDPAVRARTALLRFLRPRFQRPGESDARETIAAALIKQARKRARRGSDFDGALNTLIRERIAQEDPRR